MRIAIGCDDTGFPLKEPLVAALEAEGHDVLDLGTFSTDPVDYPDYARAVGQAVLRGFVDASLLLCGSGTGGVIAANKLRGIRAALCPDAESARASREEADANVLCLPAADLDAKVRRVLELKYKRGTVAHPYADPAAVSSVVGTPEHLATADAVTDRTTTLVRNDDKTLPLAVSGKKVLVAGYGVTTTQILADGLAAKGATTTVKETGTTPTDAKIAGAVAAAKDSDAVVVTTMKAWTSAAQQKLVNALLDTGKRVVVVATRDPYDIAYVDRASTYLATYSYSPVAVEAAERRITGEVNPSGKLPVDVPVAGAPKTVLYPFGHGLSY